MAIPEPARSGGIGRSPGLDSGAAGRQESSWIRESCWREARSPSPPPPAGHRLLGDLGPWNHGFSFLGYEEGAEVPQTVIFQEA